MLSAFEGPHTAAKAWDILPGRWVLSRTFERCRGQRMEPHAIRHGRCVRNTRTMVDRTMVDRTMVDINPASPCTCIYVLYYQNSHGFDI